MGAHCRRPQCCRTPQGVLLVHLRTINPHVTGLFASRAAAGEKLPYLARQDGQRPSASSADSYAVAGVSAFAFQARKMMKWRSSSGLCEACGVLAGSECEVITFGIVSGP